MFLKGYFNSNLGVGLADAAHAGQSGGPDADWLSFLEDLVKCFEVVGATDEVGVPGEWYEEVS